MHEAPSRPARVSAAPADAAPRGAHVHVAIVGAGFAGLGAAIRLKQQGMHDFAVLERAAEVGGVWRDNHYPGCACDVESHVYSFAFAPNPGWSRAFSEQPEIWAYLRHCADRFGVRPHLRLNHDVREAAWDDAERRWRVETSQGIVTAAVLVVATGALSEPSLPALPGLARFRGPSFHSARWDHAVDLAGKRVAVIGTGASAVQFVPKIQPVVGALHLYQRTPPWIVPSRDRPVTPLERRLFRHFPAAQRAVRATLIALREALGLAFWHPRLGEPLERLARRHLERAVADPVLRARLTPDYAIGCKRILISDSYLPALTRPNVEVVTSGIAEVREGAVVDHAGVERPADVIVHATGFRVTDFPFADCVRGRDGRTLGATWAGSPKAHLGTTVAGFPNLFILQGPNTGLGHSSVVLMQEAQIEHLLAALGHMRAAGVAALEPRPEAQAAFVAEVDRRMRGTVWMVGGCRSWYIDATGRNSTLWPDSTWRFRRRVARLRPEEYVMHPARRPEPAPALASR